MSDESHWISRENIAAYNMLRPKLKSLFDEIAELSRKKPDGPISKFKLQFINQVLEGANQLLGEKYRPFPDFQKFDVDVLPTASDVKMMLAQYTQALSRFRGDHTYYEHGSEKWLIEGEDDEKEGEDEDYADESEDDVEEVEEDSGDEVEE
jgi:hypothetical protein